MVQEDTLRLLRMQGAIPDCSMAAKAALNLRNNIKWGQKGVLLEYEPEDQVCPWNAVWLSLPCTLH